MSDIGWTPSWRRVALACAAAALVSGCSLWDGSTYDTVSVVPRRLEEVGALDLAAMRPDAPEAPEPAPPPPAPAELPLTVEECRALALAHNLDLQVQLIEPVMAEERLSQADAAFEPYLFSHFSYTKTRTPTSLRLDASEAETHHVNAGLRIPLRTGGEITVEQPFARIETDNEFAILNPAYTADLAFTVNQPLLRGGGVRRATHGMRLARYGVHMARARAHLEVILVLAAVDRVFWRLVAAREELRVRTQEYELAREQRDSAQRQVNAGRAAEIEVLRAEEAAARRLEAIIQAENAARDRERELKLVLNKPGLGMEAATVLVPRTPPEPVRYEVDRARLVAHALAHRMELLELELQIAADESTIDAERNGMLPLLSVSYTYNINALGESASDAYDLLARNRFADHRVGVALQIPLGNAAARSRYRGAVAQHRQRLLNRQRRELLITQEVLGAADQLEANWQRVVAGRQATVLAGRTLASEKRRFDEGLATSIEVLQAQARFADAQSSEIRALVEYQIAQVDLAYAAGSLLGVAGVTWDGDGARLTGAGE